MKKSIIIAAMLLVATICTAQEKTDTVRVNAPVTFFIEAYKMPAGNFCAEFRAECMEFTLPSDKASHDLYRSGVNVEAYIIRDKRTKAPLKFIAKQK